MILATPREGDPGRGEIQPGAQGSDPTPDDRDRRPPVQERRHRRFRHRDPGRRRRPDQRRLLRPLLLEGRPGRLGRGRSSSPTRSPSSTRCPPASRRSRPSSASTSPPRTATISAGGCPSAALLDEIGRCDATTRQAYTDGARSMIDAIARHLDDRRRSRRPTSARSASSRSSSARCSWLARSPTPSCPTASSPRRTPRR